jgi:hypothetical protein
MTAVLATVVSVAAIAQARGGVEGRVVDQAGRPLASAEVSVNRARATTDADGAWRITQLEPGLYRITVRRLGYRPSRQDVQVEPGRPAQIAFVLELVPFTLDSLVVSAPPSSISTTDAEFGTKLSVNEIALLPSSFDLRQLIALTPGARPDQIWGGASDQANSYSLDGTTVNHPGVGGALFLPSPNWIETLEVRGLGAGADIGGAQGGLVEVVTLGGRNVIEGAVRTSFETERLNGTNLIPGEIGHELASRRELDGQVRGPLVDDRLHFALFGHVIRQGEQVLNHLASTGGFVAQPPSFREERLLAKLSWKPGGRDLLEGSLMARHQNGDHVGQTGYEAADATERLRQWNLTANLTWQRSWSPRSALTVRLGGFVAREWHDPYHGLAVPGIEQLTRVNPPRFQNAPFRTGSAPRSLGLTAAWTGRGRLAGLEHEVQIGGEYTHGGWWYDRRRNGGMTWRPQRVLGFDPGIPATWVYLGEIPTAWGGDVSINSDVRNAALFVQEQIRIRSWLRFNPGFRYGWWTGDLTPASGGPRFTAVRAQALEPRIGMVAELNALGGLVAKAHWGRYHQSMFAALFDRVVGAATYSDEEIWSYLGPAPGTPTQTFTLAQRDSLATAGLFRLEETVRLGQAGRVDQYRQPYMEQAVLSLERAFGARWKVGVAYVHRKNRDMVALVDRNLTSNYTVVENVMILDRFNRPLLFRGQPLVLEKLAISNEDILYVQELLRQGQLLDPNAIYAPPGLTPAELAAIRYDPDFVLTKVPEATRRFEQLQLRLEARYRTWWAGASATFSKLNGNYNVVTGPDDYTNGGPGPWVRLNEQYNFFGALNNQSGFDGKVYLGGLLPARFRGGVFFSYATGDRVTPTLPISALLTEFAVAVPQPSNPAVSDTLSFHQFLFRSVTGHRIFIQPRGTYRYEPRASLDLHLERSFPRGRTEVLLVVDAFNVLGDGSITGIQTEVNAVAGFIGTDYGRVRSRVPPRTLRLGAGVRF